LHPSPPSPFCLTLFQAEAPTSAPSPAAGKLEGALANVAKEIKEAARPKQGLDANDPVSLAMLSIAEQIEKLASAAARGARQEILITGTVLAKRYEGAKKKKNK
jgi:hypothetical protein